MTHILIVESSPRGTESASRKLTDKLRERLDMQYPKAAIIERDLVKDKLPHLDQPTLKAISTKDSVEGFGDGKRAFFWIKQGKPDPAAIHWGFMAEDEDKVDEFYKAAISAGARDNISPRARLEYYARHYAADVFDPDRYSFEVVRRS